jgi:hypothetical protein
MSILLISRNAIAVIAMTTLCEGIQTRCYVVRDHQVVLDGYPDTALRHDADELLHIPNGPYRMPTPEEQERFVQEIRAKGMIQEGHDA